MAKKTVRTKYIKSLVEDKDRLAKVLEESTKESISGLLDESVNRTLRQMLSESDDDSFEVEEVKPDENQFETEPDETDTDDVTIEDGDENSDECGPEGCETEEEADGNEVWDKIEDLKDEDGEYDLRGKDINTVLDLLKDMDPEVGIRIVKNDDGTATVEPEDEEEEFVIDIEDGAEPDEFEDGILDAEDGLDTGDEDDSEYIEDIDIDSLEDGDDDETEFEVEIDGDDEDEALNEAELGYTDDYQDKTAMTMPSDNGDGNGAFNRGSVFDGGAPKGGKNNKKRWVGHDGENGGNAYSNRVNEMYDECGMSECGDEPILEVVMDTDMDECGMQECGMSETHTRGHARTHNSVGRTEVPDTEFMNDEWDTRNTFIGGKQVRNTSRNESIRRKADEILAENQELRNIAAQIKDKLDEAVVINSSLAKVIKLVTENSTTRDEKINILNRFNRVQSLKESRELYSKISSELKNAHAVNSGNLLNKQLTEVKGTNKNMIVETNLLNQSEDLKQILSLQERLSRIQ